MIKRRNAFTLVEILVVLAIIAILAALLFPAFGRARASARQTSCISNLTQIHIAVQQYRKDEGRYPDSLLDLMGESVKYQYNPTTQGVIGEAAVATTINGTPYAVGAPIPDKGTGYFKGGQDLLVCPDDDALSEIGRSSYGFLSKNVPAPLPNPVGLSSTNDLSQHVWNYWGYRNDGFAYPTATEAQAANTGCTTTACANLVNPALDFSAANVVKYSMSNRFAPPTTIITHCVYHRLQTANNVNSPGDLYSTDPQVDGRNARDIVLRLDGSAKAVDISQWNTQNLWQRQTP